MPLFARSYLRYVPPAKAPPAKVPSSKAPSDRSAPSIAPAPDRVRVVQGEFAGLKGRIICCSDPDRWLVATELPGLALRIAPHLLEPMPPE
jgi:hypothetical protein